MSQKSVVSLFSGAGGLDIGFGQAGFRTVWANELNQDACATFEAYHGSGIMRRGDLNDFLPELTSLGPIDVLIGGPPCQGFSVAGYMDVNDPRSELVFTFMEALRLVRPKAFVLENVKALAILAALAV